MFSSVILMAFLLTQTLPASNVAMEMSLTKQIEKTKELPQAREVIAVPEVNYEEIKKGYKDSAERLILLGYGGVFGPKRDRLFGPDLYDSGVIEPLTKLAANPKNKVWIITARHWDELPNSISTIPGLHVGHSRGTRLDVPEGRIVPKLPEYAEEMAKMEDQLTKVLSKTFPEVATSIRKKTYYLEAEFKKSDKNGITEALKKKVEEDITALNESKKKELKEEGGKENIINSESDGFWKYKWNIHCEGKQCRMILVHLDLYHKEILAKELLKQKKPFFAVSIGNGKEDELIHKRINSGKKFSIIVSENPHEKTHAAEKISKRKNVKVFLDHLCQIDNSEVPKEVQEVISE